MTTAIAGDILRQFIERVERLEQEKATISEDIRNILKEAEIAGFEVKVLRQLIKERRMKREEREEIEALLDLYKHALGMV